jgi:large subunit ribosomal protein L16
MLTLAAFSRPFPENWIQAAGKAKTLLYVTSPNLVPSAGLKELKPPPQYDFVEYPERRKLRFVEKVPQYATGLRPPKYQKNLYFMRGPELVHNQLIHKQYGIVATGPGRLRFGHFEMMRLTLGRHLNQKNMFAIWRVDPPWQAVTKKGQGQRMGGGKGSIDHYVTPIKSGRIIVELGGKVEFAEVYPFLKQVADQLPFKAKPVSHEVLIREAEKKKRDEERNINPYTFKYIVKNNLGQSHLWISPYDRKWFGEHT